MKITKVPQSPEYMLGVINLRGEVLPVVDARIKFGIPIKENTANTCIIVMDIEFEKEMAHIGLLVDGVMEVFEIEDEALLPPPGIGSKYKSDFIKGVFKLEDEFVMQLIIDKVFTSDELIVVNESGNELTT
jgi:purine-binding chemotaxis protein CheW